MVLTAAQAHGKSVAFNQRDPLQEKSILACHALPPLMTDALRIVARGEGADGLSITSANRQIEATAGTGRKPSSSPGLTIVLAGNCKNSGLLKSSIIFWSDDAKIVNQRPRWN